ncbi:hypothetical protein lerEdw1_015649 [Lerista edwardsae]|nr:hypothetical protein lerEdw1_015649 [Lerista edwardsae]
MLTGTNCFNSYMVDAADREKIEASRNELHNLLDKPQLQGIPVSLWAGSSLPEYAFQVLVLGNKRDLPNALDEKQLIEKMALHGIVTSLFLCCCFSGTWLLFKTEKSAATQFPAKKRTI